MSAATLPEPLRRLCHDLSQPLTAARCSLELALSLAPDDPIRASLFEDAVAALDRTTQLARAIRDWPASPEPAAPPRVPSS